MRTSESIAELAKALATAQGEMKNAKLNKVNPHFKSRYADLAEIRDTVTPALTRHGLSVAQGTDMTESGLVVVTRLMHLSGQWIESRYPIAIDKPQAMGSAYTYAKRYSLAAMCNIAADEDDDANAANTSAPVPASISADQFRQLRKLIEASKTDENKLLAFLKADALENLTVAQFKAAETALKKKLGTTSEAA